MIERWVPAPRTSARFDFDFVVAADSVAAVVAAAAAAAAADAAAVAGDTCTAAGCGNSVANESSSVPAGDHSGWRLGLGCGSKPPR